MKRREFLAAGSVAASAFGAGLLSPVTLRRLSAQGASGILRWGGNLPNGLDPHTVFDVPSAFVRANVYDSLFEYDGTPPEPIPLLVTGSEVSDDALTFTFTLRDDVRFHDGRALTSEDVVYSFRRVLALARGPASTFAPILDPEGIEAPEPHVVRFTLKNTYAPFLASLPMVAIVNSALLQEHETDGDWGSAWLANNGAGSGAYSIAAGSFVPGRELNLLRNADYFRGFPSPQPIDEVRVRPVDDDATRILAVLSGDIDTTHGYIRAEEHDRVRNAEGVRLSAEPAFRTYILRMHNSRGPTANVHFRRALSWAFPYGDFIQQILQGVVERNPGPIPTSLWGHPADLEGYSFDLDRAREELDRARDHGVDIAEPFTFLALVGFDETEQAAQLLQAQLRRLGVTMNIELARWADAATQAADESRAPVIWAHWGSSYLIDPENWIGSFYSRSALGSQRGSSYYRNDEVQDMIDRARSVLDRAERERLYEEISRRLVDEAVDIWVYNSQTFRAVRERVGGYRPAAVGDAVALREMWIEG